VGRDKGSLTEQQNRGKTGTTTIQIRRKHNHGPYNSRSPETGPALRPPKPRVPSRRAAPRRNPA